MSDSASPSAPYFIRLTEKMGRAPCLPLVIHAWTYLNEQRWTDGAIPLMWDDKAIYAVDSKEIVIGVMMFAHMEWADEVFVKIGYVTPAFRHKGIYRAMFHRLVEWAQEKNARVITGGRHVDNGLKAIVDKAMGREDRFIHTIFPVPPKTAP